MPRKVFLNTPRSPQAASVSGPYLLRRSARYPTRPYSVVDFGLPRRVSNLALIYSIVEKVLHNNSNCVSPRVSVTTFVLRGSNRASPQEKRYSLIYASLPLELNHFAFVVTILSKLPSEAP